MENPEDKAALARWLDDVGAPGDGEKPEIERLTGGSQNELFRITRSGMTGVLRIRHTSTSFSVCSSTPFATSITTITLSTAVRVR